VRILSAPCSTCKAPGDGGETSSKRRRIARLWAADDDSEVKTCGVRKPKYRLLVLKWWGKFVEAQLSNVEANKQLLLPNTATWVVKRLTKKRNNPLQQLKYDAVHFIMDTMRTYITERAKIQRHSTGKSPRETGEAEKQKDTKKASDWRKSAKDIAEIVKLALGVSRHTGGSCRMTPVTHGRAASRSGHKDGEPALSRGADKSLQPGDKSGSDSNASADRKSSTPSPRSSSSSDCDGRVLPPTILSTRASRPPAAAPATLPTTRRGGASGRSRRSLTAEEDGRAALADDAAMKEIVESTRSAASGLAAQVAVAKQRREMRTAAPARAAEATLEETNRQFQLDVMREQRESRESGRRARMEEQQVSAAVLTAQIAVPVE